MMHEISNLPAYQDAIMIRLKFDIALTYEILAQPCDFIFNIHAAQTSQQSVIHEQLYVSQQVTQVMYTEPTYGTRYMRLKAGLGPLTVRYAATVDISHYVESPENLVEMPISQLPSAVLIYIYPSRYCQSDRFARLVTREFGYIKPGYQRVKAIESWVREHTTFLSGSTNSNTSSIDTLTDQAGVCRDFAHLMIAMCRAMNIPARFVTGIDYGADPLLGPTDFHAYVEVFLSNRWYSFDPTGISPPMGLLRLGTGRDAADTSFATIFGTVKSFAPIINIEAVDDTLNGYELPSHCVNIVSTQSAY